MKFLALGDSYTIGESVTTNERWPIQLATQLRAAGVAMDDPIIIARTGWTTDELNAGIDRANVQGPFDLVSLLIGVNNQYRKRDLREYQTQFAHLLERAVAFAGGNTLQVFVLSIPDWGVTPFAQQQHQNAAQIATEIDNFNAINREESEKRHILYIDITPISRQASDHPLLIAVDGLHPSGAMYAQWVRQMLPQVHQRCLAIKKKMT